ncbi:MAG: UDP-N-acetylglucosamine 2-epimerase (non-hydrolyzing) [Xanthomonadaceae bacterium]|nr:UDP-N-acetylglucosamine 2-epimerase (non-hydrolyzing) [Xanthomonadaceae bacterium]
MESTSKRVIIVLGTRPEAIKMAPLIKKLKNINDYKVCVLSTGQHPDLLRMALESFGISVDEDLRLFQPGQHLGQFHTRAVEKLSQFYFEFKPDCVLYHGDTATAFAAAVAAFYMQIKHVHIEAGLRSFNLDSPFPEEFHRKMISQMSHYHFVPTQTEYKQLIADGIDENHISIVGNTISDSVFEILSESKNQTQQENAENKSDRKSIVVTLHRREKNDDQLWAILMNLRSFIQANQDFEIKFPIHPNPQFAQTVTEVFSHQDRIELLRPQSYPEMLKLLSQSHVVVTDSGGIQEECGILGKRVLVLRDATERALPESAELIPPQRPERLYQRLNELRLVPLSVNRPGLKFKTSVSDKIINDLRGKVLCS